MLCTPTPYISITLLLPGIRRVLLPGQAVSLFNHHFTQCVSQGMGLLLELHRHFSSLYARRAAFDNDLVLIIFVFMCVHTRVQCPWRREEDVGSPRAGVIVGL